MTGTILALDPGARTGAALFSGGQLVRAVCLLLNEPAAPCAVCLACRAQPCVHRVQLGALVRQLRAAVPELHQVDAAVIERPAWWKSSTPSAPALLALADVAGALQGAVLALGVPAVLAFAPRAWKGTTPKDEHQRGILASLDPAELEILPRAPRTGRYVSDPLDACGLGLFVLGRLGRWQSDPAAFAKLVDPAPARGKKRRPAPPAQGGLALAYHQEHDR